MGAKFNSILSLPKNVNLTQKGRTKELTDGYTDKHIDSFLRRQSITKNIKRFHGLSFTIGLFDLNSTFKRPSP